MVELQKQSILNLIPGIEAFPQAIAIIGGGTGLEVLVAAREFPEAAIVIIDPCARFARNVISQLDGLPEKDSRIRWLNWDFFEEDSELQNTYPRLWDALMSEDSRAWLDANYEFTKYHPDATSVVSRIFYIEHPISSLISDVPIFDKARMIYPDRSLVNDFSLFEFMAGSLKDDAQLEIVTEEVRWFLRYSIHGGRFITSRGAVERKGVKDPRSVYEFFLGQYGYSFVNIQKKDGQFPRPSRAFFNANKSSFLLPFMYLGFKLFRQGEMSEMTLTSV